MPFPSVGRVNKMYIGLLQRLIYWSRLHFNCVIAMPTNNLVLNAERAVFPPNKEMFAILVNLYCTSIKITQIFCSLDQLGINLGGMEKKNVSFPKLQLDCVFL